MKYKIIIAYMAAVVVFVAGIALSSCYDASRDNPYDNSPFSLRDVGPAGGLIFYINPNAATDGWKYLEAAPTDASSTLAWLSTNTWLNINLADGETQTGIGTGAYNTNRILHYTANPDARTAAAAEYCDTLTVGDYSDWFLPSINELSEICLVLHSRRWNGSSAEDNPDYGTNRVGGFANDIYWSSSERDAGNAWTQNFSYGFKDSSSKDSYCRVRAVRAF